MFTVPTLCVYVQGELALATSDTLLHEYGWNLLDYPAELTESEFDVKETANTFEIDLKGNKLVYGLVDASRQIDLSHINNPITESAFIQSLDKDVRQNDIRQEIMIEFLRRIMRHLITKRGIELSILVRFKYPFIKILLEKIKQHRRLASKNLYQAKLFGPEPAVETNYEYAFTYSTDYGSYAPNRYYNGHYKFNKHFYRAVGDMNGEEADCAFVIDSLSEVRHWARNLVRKDKDVSFSLPTSTDNFYPDFVAELNDGRILVVEYKGAHIDEGPDTDEKQNIGALWEAKSKGKGLFLMVFKQDSQGRDVFKQISDKIAGR